MDLTNGDSDCYNGSGIWSLDKQMRFAKDTKFWRYTAGRIGSESMESKSQDLECRKINSRKNLYCIWWFLVLLQTDTYIWLKKVYCFIASVVPYISLTWLHSKANCLNSYFIKKNWLYTFLEIILWLRNLDM